MGLKTVVAGLLVAGALAGSAEAFDGRQIVIQVGFAPGASFDLIARAAADRLGAYLTGNPSIIVENVEGAGSRRLLQLYLANGARDGTQLAMISPALALDPILDPGNANYDPLTFRYLVSFSNYPTYCLTTTASGIATFEDLVTADRVNVGTIGRGASYLNAASINRAFGAHFNIVSGFSGVSEANLALARGELDAFCGLSYSSIEATRAIFDFNIVAELSPVSFGLIPGADFVLDHVDDPVTRDALALVFSASLVWFPIMAHPDTPPETVTELRDAFAALATDQAFLDAVATRRIDVAITTGVDVQNLIEGFLTVDPAVAEAARALVQ